MEKAKGCRNELHVAVTLWCVVWTYAMQGCER